MMTESNSTGFDVSGSIARIAQTLESHSARSEQLRQLEHAAVDAMREAGLMRLLAPKRFGGYELPLRHQVQASMELARHCSAASWVQMVCAAHTFVAGRFPDECQKEVFGASPDVLIPGALAPQGTARKVDGGWMLDGRWQFGSGVDHGPWLLMGAKTRGEGIPPAVHLMIPTPEMSVDDTWFTLGMRGSGSKDLLAEHVFVPEHRAMPTRELFRGDFEGEAGALFRLPVMGGLATMLAGSVTGITQQGLTHFIEQTRIRDEVYTGVSKATRAGLQMRLAESMGECEVAEMLLHKNCALLDEAMHAQQTPLAAQTTALIRWNASYGVELCRRATERVYAAAGANAARDQSPLQRWFRDINTACHHAIVDFDGLLEARGRLALGLSAGAPL